MRTQIILLFALALFALVVADDAAARRISNAFGADVDPCGFTGDADGDSERPTPDQNGRCCVAADRGCDGLCHSGVANDNCGVCGGDDSSCCGEAGACGGHGACSLGECVCRPGWSGAECERSVNMCSVVDCGTHGECNPEDEFRCVCSAGWMGERCETRACGMGAWNSDADTCECISPFRKTRADGPCDACPPVSKNQTLLCSGRDVDHAVVSLMPTGQALQVMAFVRQRRAANPKLGMVAFAVPGAYNGVDYDCDCRPSTHIPHEVSLLWYHGSFEEATQHNEEVAEAREAARMSAREHRGAVHQGDAFLGAVRTSNSMHMALHQTLPGGSAGSFLSPEHQGRAAALIFMGYSAGYMLLVFLAGVVGMYAMQKWVIPRRLAAQKAKPE